MRVFSRCAEHTTVGAEAVQVGPHVPPVDVQAGVGPGLVRGLRVAEGEGGHAAVAGDLEGHAVADLGVPEGIEQGEVVGVRVDVDEARRQHQARQVDGGRGLRALRADVDDAAVRDPDVGLAGRPAQAVDDARALQ